MAFEGREGAKSKEHEHEHEHMPICAGRLARSRDVSYIAGQAGGVVSVDERDRAQTSGVGLSGRTRRARRDGRYPARWAPRVLTILLALTD